MSGLGAFKAALVPHLPVVGIVAGVIVAMAFTGGMTLQGKLKDARYHKLENTYALEKAKVAKQLADYSARVGTLSAQVGRESVEHQETVRTQYTTILRKVPYAVPVVVASGVVGGDMRVPVGALGLLDAAAAGGDAAESFTAGQSPERASPVTFAQLVVNAADNYGVCHGNAEQLRDLIQFEVEAGGIR